MFLDPHYSPGFTQGYSVSPAPGLQSRWSRPLLYLRAAFRAYTADVASEVVTTFLTVTWGVSAVSPKEKSSRNSDNGQRNPQGHHQAWSCWPSCPRPPWNERPPRPQRLAGVRPPPNEPTTRRVVPENAPHNASFQSDTNARSTVAYVPLQAHGPDAGYRRTRPYTDPFEQSPSCSETSPHTFFPHSGHTPDTLPVRLYAQLMHRPRLRRCHRRSGPRINATAG